MEKVNPIKDKKAPTDTKIASKQTNSKRRCPNRPQENPKEIQQIQVNLRKSSVPSKQSTNWLSRGYNTTDPNIYRDTTDLIIVACTIVQKTYC